MLATQDVERVQRYSRRVLVLHEGRIALDGPPGTVFEREAELREWGIGVPQVVELAHRLSRRRGRPYRFDSVSGAVARLRVELPGAGAGPAPMPAPSSRRRLSRRRLPRSRRSRAGAEIVVEHLVFTYGDGTPALRDVSLAIPAGQFLVLAGPNGSGKTTFAKHLNGLLKPSAGRVTVGGQDTRSLRVAQLARTVGYVFQNPDHQIFAPTSGRRSRSGSGCRGLPGDEIERRVDAALTVQGWQGLQPCRPPP